MAVGTVNTEFKPGAKRRPRSLSGEPGGGNHGGGNHGGGSDDGSEDYFLVPEEYAGNKSRVLMWFLLLVVLMTFAGLIGAYIVISTNGVLEWRPFDLPFQVWISTLVIVASSVTYSVANRAVLANDHERAKQFLIATTALGGVFVASQLLAWFALVQRGIYMESNPYAGFFYILTALHAVHVVGGIVALGYIVLRTWEPSRNDYELKKRGEIANAVGWYWHFMDGLWIVLLGLLGFWK